MAEQDTWVKLRQVVLAVPDVPAASVEAGREFGLARGFADPMLAEIGMDDESCILGDGSTFLEFVGPLRPDASVRRWLDKDGPGGYAQRGRPREPAYFVPGGRPMLSAIGVRPSAAEPWTGGPLVLSGVRFEAA